MSISLSVPELGGNELKYLQECVATNWVSYAGAFVGRMEALMAERVQARWAVATNSGTAALHMALLVAGVQPEEEVLVPDLTFIAPANAIRYCGAHPVFMDADPIYAQMDPEKVREFLERQCTSSDGRLKNRRSGRFIAAMLPVHVLGHPVPLQPLQELAETYALPIIEDASEALGARYLGQPVGCIGDIGCFSFNGNKIITTGGGGMIVTNRESWARQAKHLTTQAKIEPEEYVHDQVGYNYRLTNLQAAVGVAQMEQLDGFLARKRAIADRYAGGLQSVAGITLPMEAPWAQSNCWLYTIRVDAARFGSDTKELRRTLAACGVQSRPLWAPIHLQAPYRHCESYRLEVSPRLYQESLSIPCSSGLTVEDQERVIAGIAGALREPRRTSCISSQHRTN